MSKNDKIQLVLSIIGFIFIVTILTIAFRSKWHEDKMLEAGSIHADAIIINIFSSRGKPVIGYTYTVNGNVYKRNTRYKYPGGVSIGDTCEIIYATEDPSISKLLEDSNEYIIIRPKAGNTY
ncbi:hypothetical protein [Dysgonomonas macrotermitis]|uniref:DUF3592 domain-containing protein n=1 Tax=Dysgonomonas macrotermitis TaxID=1346286 RepID=A0A1M4YCP7_9BACT|nr:hypothetical protein [Dysgonomonas macrotermitis]SHF03326.1 hypothetical protein SAMN05444362_103131 [Dysgonomonas macrotermitis]